MTAVLTAVSLLTVAAYVAAYHLYSEWLERMRQPVPRTHPFGDGTACDGCDTANVFTKRPSGGYYCRRCWEEIAG